MIRGTDRFAASWRKSSYSNGDGGDCVEVAQPGAGLWVRDSKRPHGEILAVGAASWNVFIGHLSSSSEQ
jgi:uncharacterized protein DUF397